MDPRRLSEIAPLLEQLTLLPRDARERFLAEHCTDPELAAAVRELAEATDPAAQYFDDLADRLALAGERELEAQQHLELRLGPWQTRRLIGHGGMGSVYLAERADGQFEQQVALKVMRQGLDAEAARRRFLVERQIVARLEHPNIARLLDGGVAPDGRPYLAMELVVGRPITDHADSRRLSLRDRLRLFITLVEGVHAAHRLLVVHSDLKPGNVLVAEDGTVKLLDFGLAQMVSHEPSIDAASADRPLTPLYAAPELFRGDPVTTATDIYSLGVILFELLTGGRPHEAVITDPAALKDHVLRGAIDAPSARVSALAESDAGRIAAARSTTPRLLRAQLAGDLDAICLMALAADPAERYESAAALAADLRRHLDKWPVVARPDTWVYRTSRFVARHRVSSGLVLVVALLLVTFAVVLTVQSARTAAERDKATQVMSLLLDVFQVADPSESRGATVTAHEILDRATARMAQADAVPAGVRGDLLATMARVYRNLGSYTRAVTLYRDAIAARTGTLGADHPDTLDALTRLGEALYQQGQYKEAEAVLRDALTRYGASGEPRSAAAARTRNELGKVLIATSRLDEAERLLNEALAINRVAFGEMHIEVGENLTNLGVVAFLSGRLEDGRASLERALTIRRQVLGSDHPLVAAVLNNLGAVHTQLGEIDRAEGVYLDALALSRTLYGAEHPRIATVLNNVGLVRLSRGDYPGGETALRESLTMRRKLLPASHPDLAQSLSNLGLLLVEAGRPADAAPLLQEALIIRRKALGERHPLVAQTLNNLGLQALARDDAARAATLFRDALGTPGAPATVAVVKSNLARALARQGKRDEAEPLFREAAGVQRAALPASESELASTLLGLSRLLLDTGRTAEAEKLAAEAGALRQRRYPDGHKLRLEADRLIEEIRSAASS